MPDEDSCGCSRTLRNHIKELMLALNLPETWLHLPASIQNLGIIFSFNYRSKFNFRFVITFFKCAIWSQPLQEYYSVCRIILAEYKLEVKSCKHEVIILKATVGSKPWNLILWLHLSWHLCRSEALNALNWIRFLWLHCYRRIESAWGNKSRNHP